MADESDIWHPEDEDVARAQVTALASALGLPDYDSLLALATSDPATYWLKCVDFLGLVWSRRPDVYVDLSRGREFPRWFPGGELNWVDSVLQYADRPESATGLAVAAEREDGEVVRLSWAELAAQVRRLAANLHARGVTRGDRIGLLCENGAEATVTLLAIAYLGAVAVPLFSGFGADAIVSRLEGCSARGLVASTGFERRGRHIDLKPTIDEVLTRVPSIDIVVLKTGVGEAAPLRGEEWHTMVTAEAPAISSARMSPDDAFLLIYTSGTTGRPKGAVHTHGGFPLKAAHDAAVHFDVAEGDVFCWPADMGWVAGTLVLSCALLRGATLVLYDGAPDFPTWSRLSELVERHRVTHLGSAPTLIRGLAANEGEATSGDLSSLRLLITAGEAIDAEHFAWFQHRFGRGVRPLVNYTGGTEVSGALLSSVVVRPIAPGAFNTTSPGVAVDVVDASGASVRDEVGELAVREPFVGMTRSFWGDDARYLETYWRTIPGIWIHGDLAICRSKGDFVVLGRSDDTIKVAGKRLGPAEVEDAVTDLPCIDEAAAIGVPDPDKGNCVVLFVVPGGDWDGDTGTLASVVRDRVEAALGKPFRPAAVHPVPELPRTRSSKVMRRVIRSLYCGMPPGDLSALDNPSALEAVRVAGGGEHAARGLVS